MDSPPIRKKLKGAFLFLATRTAIDYSIDNSADSPTSVKLFCLYFFVVKDTLDVMKNRTL